MINPLVLAAETPAAVRRPVFEVGFGAGGDTSGGMMGALGLGADSEDPWLRSTVGIVVESALAPAVDMAELILAADEQAPEYAIEDAGGIKLGYEDSAAEQVFAGAIAAVHYGLDGRNCIRVENGGYVLSGLRINQSYEMQSAGDIVSDLAALAGVETDTVEAGIDFPFYVIDDRCNAYQHIALLAQKCGFLAHFTVEGKLFFASPQNGQPLQIFNYGQDILSLELHESSATVDAVTAVGEGAAGSQGKDAWSWLIKDPASVTAQAGAGDNQRLIQDASLRSNSAVQSAAAGTLNASGLMTVTGRIYVSGAPVVVVGGNIEINAAPQQALNGSCTVRRVRHQYSKHGGFTSLIDFSKPVEGGLGDVAGALAGLL